MASSSDPIASLDGPHFCTPSSSSLDPSWLLSRDAEVLTKSLLQSLSQPEAPTVETPNPFFFATESTAPASAASSFDPEAARKRPRTAGPSRKKRKSRSSNRSQTTFIAADAANFRRMVQQVTGVKFGVAPHAPLPPMMKPEPQQRGGCRFPGSGGLFPSLDASSSLLIGGAGGGGAEGPYCFPMPPPPPPADGCGAGGLGFESYACFPTLDSWKLI